jgi:hypothetical protein
MLLASAPAVEAVLVMLRSGSRPAPACRSLTLYDCASGRVRLRLSAEEIVPAQSGGEPFSTMAWSPDGTRLLIVPLGPAPIIPVLGPKSHGA